MLELLCISDLGYYAIQVEIGWEVNVEVALANVVDGFVVDHEGAVGVLQGGVRGQY